jgi:hypothetical protein
VSASAGWVLGSLRSVKGDAARQLLESVLSSDPSRPSSGSRFGVAGKQGRRLQPLRLVDLWESTNLRGFSSRHLKPTTLEERVGDDLLEESTLNIPWKLSTLA